MQQVERSQKQEQFLSTRAEKSSLRYGIKFGAPQHAVQDQ